MTSCAADLRVSARFRTFAAEFVGKDPVTRCDGGLSPAHRPLTSRLAICGGARIATCTRSYRHAVLAQLRRCPDAQLPLPPSAAAAAPVSCSLYAHLFSFSFHKSNFKISFTMAKGNMLQGMATGKLGDVVFARANGEQISRVRNRHPKNPRSNKQMYQRAVMATVMQAYSAGQEIFNHAFQGKSVGAENQRAFLSKNSKLLRGLIAAEIEAGTSALNCNAAVVAPGAITPVPNEYMISEGGYPMALFSWNGNTASFVPPTPEENETLSAYAQRVGLIKGDIYTFVFIITSSTKPSFTVRGVTSNTTGTCKPESQYPAIFAFLRLQVKDLSSVNSAASQATYEDVFENVASKNVDFYMDENNLTESISYENFFNPGVIPAREFGYASYGVIRSRLDQDLRSTSFMHVASKVADRATKGMYGITSPYALAAWQQGTEALGDSDLILEGGDE